jgi:hypothetical protein
MAAEKEKVTLTNPNPEKAPADLIPTPFPDPTPTIMEVSPQSDVDTPIAIDHNPPKCAKCGYPPAYDPLGTRICPAADAKCPSI